MLFRKLVFALLCVAGLSALQAQSLGFVIDESGNADASGKLKEAGNVLIPKGVIVMWYGSAADVPAGWVLCDGQNGSPDLRGRFVAGQDSRGGTFANARQTGGAAAATLSAANIPAHTHAVHLTAGYTPKGVINVDAKGPHVLGGSSGYAEKPSVSYGPDQAYNRLPIEVSASFAGTPETIVMDGNTNGGNGLPTSPAAVNTLPPYLVLAFIMKL